MAAKATLESKRTRLISRSTGLAHSRYLSGIQDTELYYQKMECDYNSVYSMVVVGEDCCALSQCIVYNFLPSSFHYLTYNTG